MDVKKLKYIFIFLSALLLVSMILMSRDAGVNCDEVLHYNHSLSVLNFFTSHGKDTSALYTPVTHLQYYGQSYDNITTILIRLFGIEDIYGFRHLMSTLAGWLTVLICALFAIWLSGYEAGIFALLLFAVSPTFLGHTQNNLKDIPFALAYISGIYFSFRLISKGTYYSLRDIILLTISIAFCISIRPGGMILICFLYLFMGVFLLIRFFSDGHDSLHGILKRFLIITLVSVAGYFLSIILWPFALHDPLRNIFLSYRVMVHYPDTFRQIFEGKYEWSDYMPWYYLIKSMAITVPVIVSLGFIISFGYMLPSFRSERKVFYFFLLVTVLFPVLFILFTGSNLYSSWRQFLFIYPGIIVLSACIYGEIFKILNNKMLRVGFILAFFLASIHPVLFLTKYPHYAYLYYNQTVGGLKGAYGNYETDYYFISQRESAEWLIKYLDEKNIREPVTIGTNFAADWFFRNKKQIRNIYIRNEERSMYDWDYAITTNRYITPYQLKNGIWPPKDALKIIYVDNVPVSAITSRKTMDDYLGYHAMEEGNNLEAVTFFEKAVMKDSTDEMIFYNFAVALNRLGETDRADSALMVCLRLNPDFEPALMYLGNIEVKEGDKERAKGYYRKLISVNRKYFEAYEALAKINK